jgi:hypothetical protein
VRLTFWLEDGSSSTVSMIPVGHQNEVTEHASYELIEFH